jgi:hypothetical protein
MSDLPSACVLVAQVDILTLHLQLRQVAASVLIFLQVDACGIHIVHVACKGACA